MVTNQPLELTVWMNIPSHYQADLFRSLTAQDQVDLMVILTESLSADRLALGWKPDVSDYRSVMLGNASLFQILKSVWSQRRRVHVLGGMWSNRKIMLAFILMRLFGVRHLIYSEVPDPLIQRSQFKVMVKHTFARLMKTRHTGVLAISQMSMRYYLGLGFPEKYAYPFGYFLKSFDAPLQTPPPERLKLIYIGQLIPRKGIDLLLEAISNLMTAYPDFSLTLVGDGAERAQYEAQAKPLGDRVQFVGAMPADQVRAYLGGFHALILPSRHDGWGVVINEALSLGVPVILSDGCGAVDLIQDGQNGFVFANKDSRALQAAIEQFLELTPAQHEQMRRAALQTGAQIVTDVVASYMIRCMRHFLDQTAEKPLPPWKVSSPSS